MDVLNQTQIDRLAKEIGAENVPVLLKIFLGELSEYSEKLRNDESLDRDHYLKEISHALKSSAASFGAERLRAYSVEIDAFAKSGQVLNVTEMSDKMIVILDQTRERYQDALAD
ncbi:Hpt domain-containing protein [Vibrio ostreicida]|nr:quorum-sensing phosphorelay protein LuxU [Vibrio ostreicida]NPD08370.1 Hpt domain-containing protein [Vibrio ostreicida]